MLRVWVTNSQSNQSLWLLDLEINWPWSTRVTDAFGVPSTAQAGKGQEESEPLCSVAHGTNGLATAQAGSWGRARLLLPLTGLGRLALLPPHNLIQLPWLVKKVPGTQKAAATLLSQTGLGSVCVCACARAHSSMHTPKFSKISFNFAKY